MPANIPVIYYLCVNNLKKFQQVNRNPFIFPRVRPVFYHLTDQWQNPKIQEVLTQSN